MLAEIVTAAYDATGHPTFRPRRKPFGFFAPNSPIGRHLTQPLRVRCGSLAEMRAFLAECRYVSDLELFGKVDHWQPPEEFEERKRGDCDDFALWTWRQLLAMGYDARFVCGRAGRYGGGHAWVTFTDGARTLLVEPLAARVADWLPRLATIRYRPSISVRWDGRTLSYYEHEPTRHDPTFREIVPLLAEWLRFVLTCPGYWSAWGRRVARAGKSATRGGPRAWGRTITTIATRIPYLWSRPPSGRRRRTP
jgi:hypothetical protein